MKWALIVATLLLVGGLHAETLSIPPRPQIEAAPIDALPAWDTIFSNALWQPATPSPLQDPLNIKFPTPPESTQVRLLWSKDFLLVRFDCHDQSIVHLPASEPGPAPRDLPYFQADAVEVFIDPVGDGRMYMEFQFSPNGGVFDAIYLYTKDPKSGPDFLIDGEIVNRDLFFIKEWNLDGLKAAARVWPASEGPGWSVVAAFPAKEILKRWGKTEFAAGMKMKVNFVRFNYYTANKHPVEITNWAPVLGGCAHVSPTGMGTITLGSKK